MSEDKPPKPQTPPAGSAEEREARLAAALRVNLRRRKAGREEKPVGGRS
jgi:hypothetical protein